MVCLPPVSTKGLTTEDVTALTEKVRNQMVAVYEKINEEIKPYIDDISPVSSQNNTPASPGADSNHTAEASHDGVITANSHQSELSAN